MTHVAAALGIPTVAIYGPTDPAVWRPLGDHVRVISPPARAPIATVPIETVLSAARQFLMGLDGFGSLHTWHFGRTAPVT
jgi:heptosyltransferase-3